MKRLAKRAHFGYTQSELYSNAVLLMSHAPVPAGKRANWVEPQNQTEPLSSSLMLMEVYSVIMFDHKLFRQAQSTSTNQKSTNVKANLNE